jgi:membrane-associated phospholipid phosphatase
MLPPSTITGRTADLMTRLPRASQGSWLWLVIAVLSLAGLGVLTMVVAQKLFIPFDQPLLTTALSFSAWTSFWNFWSVFGDYPMIPIAIGFVVWLLLNHRRREAVLVIVLLAVATAGQEVIKALVARPRPLGSAPGIPGVIYSYPSGHAFEDLVILGMLAVRLWRSRQATWLRELVAILVVVEVALVSIARVALDLHYPSDALGGILSGLVVLGLYAWWTRPGAWADHPRREPA